MRLFSHTIPIHRSLWQLIILTAVLALTVLGCRPAVKKSAHSKTVAVDETTTLTNAPPAEKLDLLANLPPPAQSRIQSEAPDAEITRIVQFGEDADAAYEVHFNEKGVSRAITVGVNGDLVAAQISSTDLPEQVRTVFQSEFASSVISELTRHNDGEVVTYSGEIVIGGFTNALTVASDGSWWSRQMDISQAPLAVQELARRAWATMTPTEVTRNSSEGEITYELVAENEGLEHTLAVSGDGKALERTDEMPMAKAPGPVQSAVKRRLATEEVSSLTQISDESGMSYRVVGEHNGQSVELTVSPAGGILTSELTSK